MRAIDDYRPDLRARRAASLTAAIMSEIGHLLGENKSEAARAIDTLLWRLGVDPLTDFDRQRIGLRPRDNKGWTDEEITAYELKMRMAMLSPVQFPLKDLGPSQPSSA